MNKIENQRKQALLQLLDVYEKTELRVEKKRAFEQINKVSSIPVDQSFLEEYWSSMSADEFCTIHSVIPKRAENITDENVRGIIELMVQNADDIDKSEYYMLKYEEAIESYFKKNSGSLREILWEDEEPNVAKIIKELSRPEVISL
jgi:hypothetical protein